MADQPRRGQLGVALDEHERDVPVALATGRSRVDLPGAGRALEHDVRAAAQRRLEQLGLAARPTTSVGT